LCRPAAIVAALAIAATPGDPFVPHSFEITTCG